MADKRINDLPALVTQASDDVYEMSNNAASLSSKETRAQMLAYMQSNITTASNVIFVAANGADAVGRGSILNPLLSLDYAISQISDLSVTTVVNVYNAQTISSLTVQPNCIIRMNKNPLTITDSMSLSSSWSSNAGVFGLLDSSSLSLPSAPLLDFDDVSALAALFYLENNNISSDASFTIRGSTIAGTTLFIDNNFGSANQINFTINDCYGSVSSGTTGYITLTNGNNSVGNIFSLIDLNVFGNLTVICSSLTFDVYQSGCQMQGSSIYESISSGTLNVTVNSMTYSSAPQLDNGIFGGTVNFVADVLPFQPVLLNGATYAPTSLANSILTNYSPTNFTPTNASVEGAIAGINAALGSVISQYIWVNATDGIDAPGRGSENAPFASLDYAYSAVGTPSAPVLINVIGNQTLVGNLVITPNIFINGYNSGIITINYPILLHSSFTSGSSLVSYIKDCRFNCPDGMSLDFVTGSSNVIILENNDYGQVGSFFLNTNNTVTQPNIIYMLGMNYISQSDPFSGFFEIFNTFFVGLNLTINNLVLTCSGSLSQITANCSLQNCSLPGTVEISDSAGIPGGPQARLNLVSSPFASAPSLSNLNALLNTDGSSYTYAPNLFGSATMAQVTINPLADGVLQSSFTPTNYTPQAGSNWLANSVTGNFAGINNALNVISPRSAFTAYLSGSISNVTGDGVPYSFICDTYIGPSSSDYNTTTGVYTASEPGFVTFSIFTRMENLLSANNFAILKLVTTSATYALIANDPMLIEDPVNGANYGGSITVYMNAGDTAYPTIEIDGNLAPNASILGGPDINGDIWTVFSAIKQPTVISTGFTAYMASQIYNVTGDGTEYQIICGNLFGPSLPQYNTGTGVYTADRNGFVTFSVSVRIYDLVSNNTSARLKLVTTLASYVLTANDPMVVEDPYTGTNYTGTITAYMRAGDTAYPTITINGNSTPNATIYGGPDGNGAWTLFSGIS